MRGRRNAAIAWAAALAVIIVLTTACSGARSTASAGSQSRSNQARVTRSPSQVIATGTARKALAARYLAIAVAGNRRLEIDFDGLAGRDRDSLARARADLRDAAATEHLFDRRLLAIVFPAGIERIARALVWLNESRAALTMRAASSATLAQLRSYQPRLSAANRPVEQAVRLIRSELGLPPPETS